MKKYSGTALAAALLFASWSRLPAQDLIITHSKDSLQGKVHEITATHVRYTRAGEDLQASIAKNIVEKVVLSNGRVEKVSDKIVVNGVDDWQKVQIANIPADVEGLVKVGELTANAASGWSTTNEGKMVQRAMEKIKKEAATKGAHMVLMLATTGKGGSWGRSGGTKASVTGVAYKYPDKKS